MPANYVLLEKITVGAAGAASVTFSGIPQTGYTDLVLKASPRVTTVNTVDGVRVTFNGNTSSYTNKRVFGTGTSAISDSFGTSFIYFGSVNASTSTGSVFSNGEMYIPNYTSSNYKSTSADLVQENNVTEGYQFLMAGLWSNTAAITSITLTSDSADNFVQYSTFYLYGVAKLGTTPAIVPYATGGDTIMTDGTYWYHTFVSSGTFTPQKAITCDYLVVAGGGGGGSSNNSGGGGAGGLRSTVTATGGGGSLESALSLASGTGYTVTIGAGGAGGVGSDITGTSGSNSVFSSITSTGGGGGGGENKVGGNGGSSGGGGYSDQAAGTRTASPVQGFNGAAGSTAGSPYPAGGGGGAGVAGGGDLSLSQRSQGGNGQAISITGSSVTYGGGGSGGRSSTALAGGTGGGGNGGQNGGTAPTAGTANLGGGGGGGAVHSGAAGGSGIVIVRYAV